MPPRRSGIPRRGARVATAPARRPPRCTCAGRRSCARGRALRSAAPTCAACGQARRSRVRARRCSAPWRSRSWDTSVTKSAPVPEGDSLHRAARRLQVLVGDRVTADSPNPRGRATGVAAQVDGRRLESVEAVGKNLILRFEGGVTVRSHLRMSGSWRVRAAGDPVAGSPWLVLRGERAQALLYGGRVLELNARAVHRLGPDILAPEPDFARMLANLRRGDRARQGGGPPPGRRARA